MIFNNCTATFPAMTDISVFPIIKIWIVKNGIQQNSHNMVKVAFVLVTSNESERKEHSQFKMNYSFGDESINDERDNATLRKTPK